MSDPKDLAGFFGNENKKKGKKKKKSQKPETEQIDPTEEETVQLAQKVADFDLESDEEAKDIDLLADESNRIKDTREVEAAKKREIDAKNKTENGLDSIFAGS